MIIIIADFLGRRPPARVSREENRKRQEEEAASRRAREAEEAWLAAEQAAVNQERVDFRSVLYEMKAEDREARALEQQLEQEERERRLERLRSLVAVEAERDPERLLQPTASSAAEDSSVRGIFHNGNGFSDDHLFRDQRFKVHPLTRDTPSLLVFRV
jgi:hypothetical protein